MTLPSPLRSLLQPYQSRATISQCSQQSLEVFSSAALGFIGFNQTTQMRQAACGQHCRAGGSAPLPQLPGRLWSRAQHGGEGSALPCPALHCPALQRSCWLISELGWGAPKEAALSSQQEGKWLHGRVVSATGGRQRVNALLCRPVPGQWGVRGNVQSHKAYPSKLFGISFVL